MPLVRKPGSETSAASTGGKNGNAEVLLPGKLIVIEGTDGSGKKTQAQLLIQHLHTEGHDPVSVSFPQYGKKSAGLVEEYLNGRYGKPDEVTPYTASLFYALDRFDLSFEIRKALEGGKIIITDRYVDANAGHQGGKIKDPTERKKYLSWLYYLEYEILGIPKPNHVLILHVPAEMGQRLATQKQQRLYIEGDKTLDAHESDIEHLKAAEAAYLWLAEQFPEDHSVIECVEGDRLLSPEETHEKVWQEIKPLLNISKPFVNESELVLEKL